MSDETVTSTTRANEGWRTKGVVAIAMLAMVLGITIPFFLTYIFEPRLETRGNCANIGGIELDAANFSPGGQYAMVITGPTSEPYDDPSGGEGRFDRNGGLMSWRWDCRANLRNPEAYPYGDYLVVVVDRATGKTADTTMTVTPPTS